MCQATKTRECDRCCGLGRIPSYRHVEAGLCFACNGTGRLRSAVGHAPARKAAPQAVLTSDRYPGWEITRHGGAAFNLTKGGRHILVAQNDGRTWTGHVEGDDGTTEFRGSVADAVAYCEAAG